MSPLSEVAQLARDADIKLDETFNSPDVLPFASKALDIIAAHPELQASFEIGFMNLSYKPREFIEVCMHALRWPRVKAEYERRYRDAVARNDWNAERVYRHCLDAFEPNWEDASDFYAEYFRR